MISRTSTRSVICFAWGAFLLTAGSEAREPKSSALSELPFTKWGAETLLRIEKDLGMGALYAEWGTTSGERGNEPGRYSSSYVWPASFQLRALASATKVRPRQYRKRLLQFTNILDRYWTVKKGLGGYMVLPSPSERFYDDNAWMLLGLLDAFDVTRQKKFLSRALQTLEFLADGEKKTEGGGIRQHEDKDGGLFTCTTAPAAVGAVRLYLLTRKTRFLQMAERWHAILNSAEVGVRDPGDGLFHQWAKKEGAGWRVERGKRAYQSALPLQLDLLLYRAKKDRKYLEDAQRIAASSITRWVRPDGALAETAQWGGSDLCDALLDLYEVDKDERWLRTVRRVLQYLHENGRDPDGRYGENWQAVQKEETLEKFLLLHMAPAARAYWRAAAYEKK